MMNYEDSIQKTEDTEQILEEIKNPFMAVMDQIEAQKIIYSSKVKTLADMSEEEILALEKQYGCKVKRPYKEVLCSYEFCASRRLHHESSEVNREHQKVKVPSNFEGKAYCSIECECYDRDNNKKEEGVNE